MLKDFLNRMGAVLSIFLKSGIVHADLKPDNILVDYDESSESIVGLKVIDFGSAFILSEKQTEMKD